jgi:hypothetical protein
MPGKGFSYLIIVTAIVIMRRNLVNAYWSENYKGNHTSPQTPLHPMMERGRGEEIVPNKTTSD